MNSLCSVYYEKNLVDLDKRNTNKEIVLHKKLQPFLYICILALVLQIYPNFLYLLWWSYTFKIKMCTCMQWYINNWNFPISVFTVTLKLVTKLLWIIEIKLLDIY